MPHASWGGPGVARKDLVRIMGVGGLPLYVHKDVSVIHQYLANELHKLRQKGAPALSSDGGYVKRYISGTTKWSNHSWGLATDYNAATNPYSYNGGTDFRIAETRELVKSLEGMRWGHDYSGKKDAMHFEWIGSRELAAQVTKKLQGGTVVDSKAYSVGSTGPKVLELKLRLKLLGYTGFSADDKFDEHIKLVVKDFQRSVFKTDDPKIVDGIVGKDTSKELEFASLKLGLGPEKTYAGKMRGGDVLYPGQKVVSQDGRSTLILQEDGNVVLYTDNLPAWQTGIRGTHLSLNRDGNLVLYLGLENVEVPVWNTNTAARGIMMYLALQNDGNLVMYGEKAYWNTGTGKKS